MLPLCQYKHFYVGQNMTESLFLVIPQMLTTGGATGPTTLLCCLSVTDIFLFMAQEHGQPEADLPL